MDKLEKVEVEWIDAWSSSDDAPFEANLELKPIMRRNVGYLLKKDGANVIIAAGISEKAADGNDSYCDRLLIPWCMIQNIMTLVGID